jgi:hypothetical protein
MSVEVVEGVASTLAFTVDDGGNARSSGATWVQAIAATASGITMRGKRS